MCVLYVFTNKQTVLTVFENVISFLKLLQNLFIHSTIVQKIIIHLAYLGVVGNAGITQALTGPQPPGSLGQIHLKASLEKHVRDF